MIKRSLAASVAGALVATAVAAAPLAPAQSEAPAKGTDSLAALLGADGQELDDNWKDFDITEAAVLTVIGAKPKSPLLALTKGNKALTAFIPTDMAFRKLVADLTGATPATEQATVDALLEIADVDTIEAVLLYHVVDGATLDSGDVVAAAKARTKVTTASGVTFRVTLKNRKVVIVDKDRDDADAKAITKALDLNEGNRQIAHGINRVLRPLDL